MLKAATDARWTGSEKSLNGLRAVAELLLSVRDTCNSHGHADIAFGLQLLSDTMRIDIDALEDALHLGGRDL